MSRSRTFVIGDVHGERALLSALLGALPFIGPEDALVFLGDYLDRGPDPRGVIEILRRLPEQTAGQVVCLRGNHEDALLQIVDGKDPSFLIPPGNGVLATFASYEDRPAPASLGELDRDGMNRFFDVGAWMPAAVIAWIRSLPLWHRDAHATYVHAGLEGEGTTWSPPEASAPASLLWQREPDFFTGYGGPPLVFGHTPVEDLPPPEPGRAAPWLRGPLIGLDTGAGKGGPLTCLELPSGTLYQAQRDGQVTRSTLTGR
ncbi:MAG TPA: metallophosphoesterase family protein [Kofleriaceae bacterium]|nr:metallophosphoesterase family protein [Kofleriaceae bacterium]